MSNFTKVEASIKYLMEDSGTSRNIREKLSNMLQYIKQPIDDQTKISTILSDLEELSMDVNIPPFIRTQLYSISSILEAMNNE